MVDYEKRKISREYLKNLQIACLNCGVRFDILDSEWDAFTSCIYEIINLRNKKDIYDNVITSIIRESLMEIYSLRHSKSNFNLYNLLKMLYVLKDYDIKESDIALIQSYIKELTSWGDVTEFNNFISKK